MQYNTVYISRIKVSSWYIKFLPVLESLSSFLERPFPVFSVLLGKEFVPGHLLLPLSRDKKISLSWDKGTTERPVLFCPGMSHPVETLV